jgi:hypothetical protein
MAQGTVEEQLKKAQLAAAKLREQLKKAKAAAKRKGGSGGPSFPGAHRGY